jgi:uncharacterized protein
MKCDAVAREYLPGMRAEMVIRLINQKGMSQSDAARKLGMTRAAISQYMSRKRGADIELSGELDELIERWAMVVSGEDEHITLCDVCKCAMKKRSFI